MKDKIFKAIKCVLFMLPFVFVGGKTLYTILNENAKDSYTGEIVDYTYSRGNDLSNVTNDFTYLMDFRNLGDSSYTFCSKKIYYISDDIYTFFSQFFTFGENALLSACDNFALGYGVGQTYNAGITFFQGDTRQLFLQASVYNSFFDEYLSLIITNVVSTNPYIQDILPFGSFITYIPVYSNTLDTAFEYGLNEFNNIGFGKIDFLVWFNDLFLNNNFNNVYSSFINSYLNYFLFVELVMFIPSVFHWVIHFFTEIGNNALSRSTKKKKGED